MTVEMKVKNIADRITRINLTDTDDPNVAKLWLSTYIFFSLYSEEEIKGKTDKQVRQYISTEIRKLNHNIDGLLTKNDPWFVS